jgi:hypothetical protein
MVSFQSVILDVIADTMTPLAADCEDDLSIAFLDLLLLQCGPSYANCAFEIE